MTALPTISVANPCGRRHCGHNCDEHADGWTCRRCSCPAFVAAVPDSTNTAATTATPGPTVETPSPQTVPRSRSLADRTFAAFETLRATLDCWPTTPLTTLVAHAALDDVVHRDMWWTLVDASAYADTGEMVKAVEDLAADPEGGRTKLRHLIETAMDSSCEVCAEYCCRDPQCHRELAERRGDGRADTRAEARGER